MVSSDPFFSGSMSMWGLAKQDLRVEVCDVLEHYLRSDLAHYGRQVVDQEYSAAAIWVNGARRGVEGSDDCGESNLMFDGSGS